MAYSEALVTRVRALLAERDNVTERKMFGGVAFMVAGHMCVGVSENRLMARVGPHNYATALQQPHASEMDFTGKPMKGFVFVAEEGIQTQQMLSDWVSMCEQFILTLPPK